MTHDVISAFIDNEPFDPPALARALADPGGRDLLIDLIALRQVVTTDAPDDLRANVFGRHGRWRMLGAAAALVVAIGGGYAIGRQVAARTHGAAASDVAPAPTRVIELKPGVDWHQTGGGH